MSLKNLRVPIGWTDQHSIKYSLLLALTGYVGTIVLQIIYPDNVRVGLPDFWRAYSLIAAALGFVIPQILVLGKRILFRFLPRPGALTFEKLTIRELSQSFEFDRTRLAAAMVPDHIATAAPAQNSRRIDLGDAALILDEQQKWTIQQFIGHPKKFASISNGGNLERNVLMVTGEPGAGKSVLVQEIHATLSTGVEKGYHSFVPLLLFARDLTFQSLETLLNTQSPLQGLVIEHYKKLLVKDPMGSQLKALYQLVSGYWKTRDFLIIIDGLDEIAQRSAYEKIQTALVKMIQLDLGTEGTGTHRYILTCRIDEDLEIFSKARGIRLRGLSPERREQFCAAQLRRFHLPSATKNSLERALKSHRIVPSHVFARNPYFLALLIRHLTSDEEHVRQERIDFDFLMQRYLEREAVRPHAALKPNRQYSIAERHTLFNEMEKLSRAPLQLLAFRSAISAQTAALYDEKPIDADTFKTFCNNIDYLEHSNTQALWINLKWFFSLISVRSQTAETIINSPTTAGFLNHLHENDVRIMSEVAQAVRSQSNSPAKLIRRALGRIRVLGLAESEEWYEEFTTRLSSLLLGFNSRDQIKILFFIRGIAAAHLLRILNVSLTSDSVRVRFRHRRLAEYYAACYARDRWQEIQPTVALTPWVSPVLNLTAALEGPRSLVLSWLVNLVESGPKHPLYKWRYVVESTVEASFFSEPGDAYQQSLARLCINVMEVLRNHSGSLSSPATVSLDPVTETALLRALPEIASLRSTFQTTLVTKHHATSFYQYQTIVGPEWMGLIVDAAKAVERVSTSKQPLMVRLKTLWRLMEQPLPLILEGSRVFSSNPVLWFLVLASMILSELVGLAFVLSLSLGIFRFAAYWLGATPEDTGTAVKFTLIVLLIWRVLSRIKNWVKSPLDAAMKSARVWRFFGQVPRSLKKTSVVVSETISGIRYTFSLRGLRKTFAALTLIFLILIVASVFFSQRLSIFEDEPCLEVNEARREILRKYSAVPENLSATELWNLRVRLRDDLATLRATNVWRRCGWKQDDGNWLLVEENVVDELIARDSRLLPAPDPSVAAWNSDDSALLNKSLSNAVEAPEPGLIGSLATVLREREVTASVENARTAKTRLIAARRAGVENFSIEPATNKSAFTLINDLNRKIEEQENLAVQLRDRRNRFLFNSVIIGLVCAMIPWLIITILRQRKNHRLMIALRDTTEVHGLFNFVTNKSYSDKVRAAALERLDEVGVQNPDELAVVETYVGKLYGSSNAVDRSLAIRAASIARVLSKRLSHRA